MLSPNSLSGLNLLVMLQESPRLALHHECTFRQRVSCNSARLILVVT